MDRELEQIKVRILEIRDSLSEPLKSFLNKKINQAEGDYKQAKCIVYFDTCLKYAEKCKKIEKDFPFRWFECLTTDKKLLNTFLSKLFSVCVLGSPPNEIDRIKYKVYGDLKEILGMLLSSSFSQSYGYQTQNLIKKNTLELLILFLSKQERVDFNKEYGVFFEDIICLIDKNTINLNYCLNKIDKMEKSEYFSHQTFVDIRQKYFDIIFLIDPLIIYRNLLAKLEEIAQHELSHHQALLNFINRFVFEFFNEKKYFDETSGETPNENLNLVTVLIYQALNRKFAQAIIPPSKIDFVKALVKLSPKSTFGGQLSKFKQDYEDKTGKEFPADVLSSGPFSKGKQVHKLSGEIGVYFDRHEVNRSPKAVKQAFKRALRNYDNLALSEVNQAQVTLIEKGNKFIQRGGKLFKSVSKVVGKGVGKGVEKLTEQFQAGLDRASDKVTEALEKGQEVKDSVIDSLTDTVNNLKPLVFTPKVPINKQKLHRLRVKLEDMVLQLYGIQSFLKESIGQDRSSSMIINDDEEIVYLNDEEYANLEMQATEIERNLESIYINTIDKFKPEIENNSWFENKKFSLKERIKLFFTRGFYGVNIEKLKSRLNNKIDFIDEKDFFLKVKFSSLLHYGIARWPWLNKEEFARKWAEQIILLKIKDGIEIKNNEDLSKADFLLEILKIYHKVFSRPGKKDFLFDLYPNIHQASIKYLPELGRLFRRINSRIGFKAADLLKEPEVNNNANSPTGSEINLDNTTAVVNAGNEEQADTSQPSLPEDTKTRSFVR